MIGLRLVAPAELELAHLVDHGRGELSIAAPVVSAAGADTDGNGQDLAELAFGHLLGRVPIDDVPDLVTEHAGELGLVLQAIEQALGDEDLPARAARRR